MKKEISKIENKSENEKLTLAEFNEFVRMGSAVVIKLAPLLVDAYKTLKEILDILKKNKK